MFRTILTLDTPPEKTQQLIDHYAKYEVIAEGVRQAGALSCEFCVSVDNPGALIAIALWPSERDYQNWIEHPVRAKVTEGIAEFMPYASGKVYRVIDQVTRESLGLD
jgi:heme-degrading monooxygenase HmoA